MIKKYGYLWYRRTFAPNGRSNFNIGDPIQSYAAIQLYKSIGIPDEDIVPICQAQPLNRDVKDTILCMNAYSYLINSDNNIHYKILPPAKGITPLYIGVCLYSRNIDKALAESMRIYGPIGCRDKQTMDNLIEHGIPAYVSGCLTLTLPKREKEPENEKVFFVDVPDSLSAYIPAHIKENGEVMSHQPGDLLGEPHKENAYELITDEQTELYHQRGYSAIERYKHEATLVVTSRLHVAAPCLAMGIPVILVNNDFDLRYSFLEKFLPMYTPDKFGEIDWKPAIVDLTEHKENVKALFTAKIRELEAKARVLKTQDKVDCGLKNAGEYEYNLGWRTTVKKIYEANKFQNFAFWGVLASTCDKFHVISETLPNSQAVGVIDQNVEGTFEGFNILKPELVDTLPDDTVVFVVAYMAQEYAKELLTSKKRRFVLVQPNTFVYYEPGKETKKYDFHKE